MAAPITHIHNREEHDAVVAESDSQPTVIYVCNSATPVCKAFTPKYEGIATDYAEKNVRFSLMDFNSATSHMFKFAPNQLPVITLMYGGRWCKTVMGADVGALKAGIGEMLVKAGHAGD